MDMVRAYGAAPYRALVLHGGPGAPGCAAGLCRGLQARGISVLEHLQTGHSAAALVEEMLCILDRFGIEKITVIGHSYGAWLALLFAAKHPDRVAEIVIIGCGPLTVEFLPKLMETRRARQERGLCDTDNFCALPGSSGDMLYFDKEQHISLMNEMTAMRKSGELLNIALSIPGRITAIHGIYDPHPVQALEILKENLSGFTLNTLEQCGHDPWKERYAQDEFFGVIMREIF